MQTSFMKSFFCSRALKGIGIQTTVNRRLQTYYAKFALIVLVLQGVTIKIIDFSFNLVMSYV